MSHYWSRKSVGHGVRGTPSAAVGRNQNQSTPRSPRLRVCKIVESHAENSVERNESAVIAVIKSSFPSLASVPMNRTACRETCDFEQKETKGTKDSEESL